MTTDNPFESKTVTLTPPFHFTVRIVLRNINEEDSKDNRIYTALHKEMEELNFKRTIENGSLRLPDAEYFISYNTNCEDVADYAKNAIMNLFEYFTRYKAIIDNHYSILVTGRGTYLARNLEPTPPIN
ncbi:hypothetical protein F0919_00785 [Taibaiella lutea]|uniref:Uncharacterized protein n=1 Tax=Taibaiella lutea TaxID=2608001 RepID=A0A5M6CM79_9BACT|nr:hypothetical protein [Taibaiella lutea]KAA5536234.1 hypothetical protein F0919_00785 [Taibaiella lutea]